MIPKLAKYEILGGLASGGMADVWLARARGPGGFEKVVVIKTILPHLAHQPQFVEMFLNEARVAAMLNHPNCVQIYDLGTEAGTYYLAMEFIEGFALSRVMRRVESQYQLMSVPVVCRVVMDALAGLDYAHRLEDRSGKPLGLVHRDVSPDNVLISFSGLVKVVDFGIAKAGTTEGPTPSTRTGTVKGKFGYMSPEYLQGKVPDGRSDLFAIGVVMYRALTGKKPFTGATDAMITKAVLDLDPVSPRSLNPLISPALDEVLLRSLAKDPDKRFESARVMRAAIEEATGKVPEADQVGAFFNTVWPASDPERVKLRSLASGKAPHPSMPVLEAVKSEDIPIGGAVIPHPVTSATKPETTTMEAQRSRKKRFAIGIAAAILITAGIAIRLVQSSLSAVAAAEVTDEAPVPVPIGPDPAAGAAPATAAPANTVASAEPAAGLPKSKGVSVGRLVISSTPAAEIFWKSRRLGTTPGAIELPPGRQKIVLQNQRLGFAKELIVVVPAGGTAKSNVTVAKAWLEVRASPWAEVKIDGKGVGTTPVAPQELWEGLHSVELVNPELSQKRKLTVDLAAGEHKTLRESLE